MNMGPSPVIGVIDMFESPGTYEMTLPCPKSRTTALVELTLVDGNQRQYKDTFAVSFHMHWFKFIKVIHYVLLTDS